MDDDFASMIGIDPGSIDYSTSPLSNDQISSMWDNPSGNYSIPGSTPDIGYDPSGQASNQAPLSPLTQTSVGSPGGVAPVTTSTSPSTSSDGSATTKVGKTLSDQAKNLLNDKNGDLDLGKLIKLGMGLTSFVSGLNNSGKSPGAQTAQQLQQQLVQNKYNAWSPSQQLQADKFFNSGAPAHNLQPMGPNGVAQSIVPGRGYAMGGRISGALSLTEADPLYSREPHYLNGSHNDYCMGGGVPSYADGGPTPPPGMGALGMSGGPQQQGSGPFSGYIDAPSGGQDDLIQINVAGGEYVWDADTVSALGDGNNAAGAAKLDQMREAIRAQKRSAPPDQIPPRMDQMQPPAGDEEQQ